MRALARQAACVLAAAALAACGSEEPTGSANTPTVRMLATAFSPNDVSVAVGQTVRWVNEAATSHTITPEKPGQLGSWTEVSVPPQQNFTFSHTFTTAGTFNYRCAVHPGMNGKVTVR
jgi:plastocyanin